MVANIGLVALQRYNRARMVRFVDRRLQAGDEFNPGYENWLGVDARAAENFEASQRPVFEPDATYPTTYPQAQPPEL